MRTELYVFASSQWLHCAISERPVSGECGMYESSLGPLSVSHSPGSEHLWRGELKMNDALCAVMIIHSTLWEAIKIFPLRIFFQVCFKVTPEKVTWSIQEGSLYLTWQSFPQNILLFYSWVHPAVKAGRDRSVPATEAEKQASHLHCVKQIWVDLTMPYSTFRILRSVSFKWSFMSLEYPLPKLFFCTPLEPRTVVTPLFSKEIPDAHPPHGGW